MLWLIEVLLCWSGGIYMGGIYGLLIGMYVCTVRVCTCIGMRV